MQQHLKTTFATGIIDYHETNRLPTEWLWTSRLSRLATGQWACYRLTTIRPADLLQSIRIAPHLLTSTDQQTCYTVHQNYSTSADFYRPAGLLQSKKTCCRLRWLDRDQQNCCRLAGSLQTCKLASRRARNADSLWDQQTYCYRRLIQDADIQTSRLARD